MAVNCGKLNPLAAVLAGVCIVTAPAHAQITLEGNAGVGFSAVDIDAWAGNSYSVGDRGLTSRLAYLQLYFVKVACPSGRNWGHSTSSGTALYTTSARFNS